MKKMYQVFVSSTYSDLIDVRNIAYQIILDMGQIPVGYQDIAATNNIQDTITPLIDNSEIFVLIIGEKYGSISANGNSYVEEEYNFAISQKKPILCFIKKNYENNADPKFQTFVSKLFNNHFVSLWDDVDDFKMKLTTSIYNFISQTPPDTYWKKYSNRRIDAKTEIDKYFNEVVDAIGLDNNDNDILGLMALNLRELKEFYTLTKKQAIRSFSLSVCMCILGFILIIFATIIALLWNESQIAFVTSIGGTIVEVIAGTSLFVYKKSLEQLNFYYLSLHDNERFMSLINISAKTSKKEDLYSQIVKSELERLKNTKFYGENKNENH